MTKPSAVKNGRLTIPLFHGTSSLHYDSIRLTGLGGRDVVEDMGIRKAARLLLELSADYVREDDWLYDIDSCQRIAADPANDRLADLKSGFFFSCRYGGTYLSASRETAAMYSFLYAGGGEALTHTLKLHRRLLAASPEIVAAEQFAPLVEFANRPAKPLIVEARDVKLEALRTEHGSGLEDLLDRIVDALENPDYYDCLVGQHNFELIQQVPSGQLRFYDVTKVLEFDDIGASREVLQFSPYAAV
jgi:hypothetical protein